MKLTSYLSLIKRAFFNAVYADDRSKEIKGHIKHQHRIIKYEIAKNKFESLSFSTQEKGISINHSKEKEIIISLTTHGKRIHSVFRTIECMFQQTYKANRIVLWLGNKEYNNINELPITLQNQIKRGLEVKFVKDIRSYTKLIYALKLFPNAAIITIDDDILYPCDFIEKLVFSHSNHPTAICCNAVRHLELKTPKKFYPYRKNELETKITQHYSCYIAEGFAGILYPPYALSNEVFNEKIFLSLAPNADDIWFKAMALLNNTPLITTRYENNVWDFILIDEDVQDIGLINKNVYEDRNDKQLSAIFDYYKLYDKLLS